MRRAQANARCLASPQQSGSGKQSKKDNQDSTTKKDSTKKDSTKKDSTKGSKGSSKGSKKEIKDKRRKNYPVLNREER